MPTCAQITDAINVLAEAATPSNPNSISDLSSSVAPLVLPLNQPEIPIASLQLQAGGEALLTAPTTGTSIDGKLFKITVTGYVTSTSPLTVNVANTFLVFGDSFTNGIWVRNSSHDIGTPGVGQQRSFAYVYYFYWDSYTQKVLYGNIFQTASVGVGNQTLATGVISQSDIKFSIFGRCSATDSSGTVVNPTDTLTITQFKLDLV